MKKLALYCLSALLLTNLTACDKEAVAPQCVNGIVLGTTCDGAYLIQLDTDMPLGKSLVFQGDGGPVLPGPESVAGTTYANVVETFTALPSSISRGQQLFFDARPATEEELVHNYCMANRPWYEAPQVVLTNISQTACAMRVEE
ncbi:hypothetical protein [Hymenobacter sp. GOD-10R]|uniref:hypothetical protein n=1 Tax=Hymenobacter sp. GOD-10R TaxID=3093922 RepID=UPI002D77670B|nr:hypothetical protein [Hymenobacter sp. GOD-10R]WRQ27987.1 hypothetical protein SD425_23215 [Hymenobacter sp. GOD-10R]